MSFYDLPKAKQLKLVEQIESEIFADLQTGNDSYLLKYVGDSDTYIRKTAYLKIAKIYKNDQPLRSNIISRLKAMYDNDDERIRQTVAYTLGEIGKVDAPAVLTLLERALHDSHHKVRNGVIGALKQMCQKNPKPTLQFAASIINHDDPKVRREIVHGIELHGRTHPEDVLPLLHSMQHDPSRAVVKMVIHVLGQISYKKGCLEKVIAELKTWDNHELVQKALDEIIAVHRNYAKFSAMTVADAKAYIKANFD